MAPSADEVRERLRAQIAAIEARGSSPSMPAEDGGGPNQPMQQPFPAEGSHPSPTGEGERVRRLVPAEGQAGEVRAPGSASSLPDAASEPDREEEERAFRKIERLAGSREQASEALRRRLAREGFAEPSVEAALGRALACGLVDDRRYADVLVRSRLAQGKGRRGIAAELVDLGIDPDEVDELADPAGAGDDAVEVDRALAVLDRKPPRAKNRRDAAYRRLAQKGFGASVASTAARLWCEANPD